MELRQAVDGALEQVGPRVLEAVPARVVGGVAQPEVGPEVDDRGPAREEVRDERRGRAVGEGQEDGIHLAGARCRRSGRWWRGAGGCRRRVAVAVAAARPTMRDVRVAGEQPDQLGADVAGRPDDADPDPARPAAGADAAHRRGARRGRRDRLDRVMVG